MRIGAHIARRVAAGPAFVMVAALALAAVSIAALPSPAPAQPPGALRPERDEALRIREIRFTGNRHTSEGLLRRELGLEVGDSCTLDSLDAATERLEATRLFTFVDIEETSDGEDGVALDIHVEERQRARLGLDPDYDRRFSFHPEITLRLMNIRGWADHAWATVGLGKRRVYGGGWTSPWLAGDRRFTTELEVRHESYRFMFLPMREKDTRVSFIASAGERSRIMARAGGEYRRVKLLPGAAATGETAIERDLTDPAFVVGLEHDGRKRVIYPGGGIHASAEARFSGIGQGVTYQQYAMHLAGFGHLPGLPSIGARTSWVLSGGHVPDYERIYLGGPETVRGLDIAALRGDRSFLATIEIRRPIIDVPLGEDGGSLGVGLHAFSDWGKAWDREDGWDSTDAAHAFGAGVHVNVFTGSLRFEWARHVDENVYVFGDEFTF